MIKIHCPGISNLNLRSIKKTHNYQSLWADNILDRGEWEIAEMTDCKIKSRWMFVPGHHHHHVVLVLRISLTLSRHFSLSFIASSWSSGLHPVSSHSCWMYVRAGRPAFARPCVGVHKSTSLMSSSLWFSPHSLSFCLCLTHTEINWQQPR